MKIVLFGASDITPSVADLLLEMKDVEIAAVVTAQREFRISYSKEPVINTRHADMRQWAERHSIPCHFYESSETLLEFLKPLKADFGLIAGWYHMVPARVRDTFSKGCAGFHASLLPELRGGAPLNWAILKGFKKTGVSFFVLADGVDNGNLYGQESFAIGPQDYIGDLVKKSESAIASLIRQCVPGIVSGKLASKPQKGTPTYALQRSPEDSRIDWGQSAESIHRLIRATSRPYPGAFGFLDGRKIIFWRARPAQATIHGSPGQIAAVDGEANPFIVTGAGALEIQEATDEEGHSALNLLLSKKQNFVRQA